MMYLDVLSCARLLGIAFIAIVLLLSASVTKAQIPLRLNEPYFQDFVELGTEPDAPLPEGIRVGLYPEARTILPYDQAQYTTTRYRGGAFFAADAPPGVYNIGAGDSTMARSRALGAVLGNPDVRSAVIYLSFINDTGISLSRVRLGEIVASYNCGANPVRTIGHTYYSLDGIQFEATGGGFIKGSCTNPRGLENPPGSYGGGSITIDFSTPVAPQETFFIAYLFSIEEGSDVDGATINALEHVYLSATPDFRTPAPIWPVPLNRHFQVQPIGVSERIRVGTLFIPFDGVTYDIDYEVTGKDAEDFAVELFQTQVSSSTPYYVTFTPSHPGWHTATLIFSHADTTSYPIQLSGEGLPYLFESQTGDALRASLRSMYVPQQTLDYEQARDTLLTKIDGGGSGNGEGTVVRGFYTEYSMLLPLGGDPSEAACNGEGDDDSSTCSSNLDLTPDYLWPASLGAEIGSARSDLHNLVPVRGDLREARNSYFYGDVEDTATDLWFLVDTTLTTVPTSFIGRHAELDLDTGLFEPPEARKGDVARALFYFYLVYKDQADAAFFEQQKEVLLNWHRTDPISLSELERSHRAASFQGNDNPFVLDTSLVHRAFFDTNTDIEYVTDLPTHFSSSSIYPNPSLGRSWLTLRTLGEESVAVALYDVLGRHIKTFYEGPVVGEKVIELDVAWLPAGVYFIRSTGQQAVITRRMVKVR